MLIKKPKSKRITFRIISVVLLMNGFVAAFDQIPYFYWVMKDDSSHLGFFEIFITAVILIVFGLGLWFWIKSSKV